MRQDQAATPTLPYVFGECLGAYTALGRIYGGYRTVELIAEGGMGTIHRAEELATGAHVALKTLGIELLHDKTARARLLHEGRATRLCRHPNVVRLLDLGENTGGEPYLALELLEGTTLAQHLRRVGVMSIASASALGSQMLRALERIHAMRVVHRDLKTDNFILIRSPSGGVRVKIIDFGIAHVDSDAGQGFLPDFAANLLVGTPRYMSPEQASCERDLDCRSDIYSLGVVLYQLVTGSLPHATTGMQDRELAKVLATAPTHLLERRKDVPRSFADIVMRALSHDRKDRWPSARSMRLALERAMRRDEGLRWK